MQSPGVTDAKLRVTGVKLRVTGVKLKTCFLHSVVSLSRGINGLRK